MKDEFGQGSEDRTSLICHRKEGGGVLLDCAENAEGNEQGMPEIIVQLEDEQLHMTPDTDSSPENDIFLFAPVSDIEDVDNYESDSSSVPAGKQQSTVSCNMDAKIKLEKCAKENYAFKTDQKPRRKKPSNPSAAKRSSANAISSSTNDQTKRRGKNKVKTQPGKSRQAEQECRIPGETAGWIPAPYTKPEAVISPQAAMEAPGFPSLQGKKEEPFCDKKDNILLEVLKYCQTLCTVVQRLEQKIDSLQADCSRLQLHINRENTKEDWQSAIQRLEFKVIELQSHVPTLSLRQPNKPCTSSILGRNQPSWKDGNSQCQISSIGNTLTRGPNRCDSQPDGYWEADKADTNRIAQRGRGGGRGRRGGRTQGRGRSQAANRQKDPSSRKKPPVRANQPKRRVDSPVPDDDGPCASKVAKILSELQGRRTTVGAPVEEASEASKSKSASDDKEQQVMIGSAFRKVWIPYSVYMEAFKQEEPQRAVVPVLHAVFPHSVLSCSAVVGNPQRGIQELSPNKLEAIREWLAEMYPRHELEVKGKAWAECLGVLNSITRKLKSDTTPTKNILPEVP